MTPNYTTLFDKTYLYKGMALIDSIRLTNQRHRIHVLALDAETYAALRPQWWEGSVTSLADVADAELQDARRTRTHQEFCWLLMSWWLSRCVQDAKHDSVTSALDADSFFFSDPQPVFDEIGEASIALVPHRIVPERAADFTENGFYNANFVYVRHNAMGRQFAEEWRDLCLEWCYYKTEDGKFADQGHLDTLAKKFRVFDIQHPGLNLAPWSAGQYAYSIESGDGRGYKGKALKTLPPRVFVDGQELILYHFHELLHDERGAITQKTHWDVPPLVEQYVYGRYEQQLKLIGEIE